MTGGSVRRRMLTGSALAGGGRVGTILARLAITALLARLLAPEAMGAYFLAFTMVTFLATASRLGLAETALWTIAESLGRGEPGNIRPVVLRIVAAGAGGAAIVALVLVLGAGRWLATDVFGSPTLATIIPLVALWMVLLGFQAILSESLRGFHAIGQATLHGGLLSGGLAVGGLGAAWLTRGQLTLGTAVGITIAAEAVGVAAGALALSRRVAGAVGPVCRTFETWEIMAYAWPLLVTQLLGRFRVDAGVWILGAARPEGEVAVYAAAARLVLLTGLTLQIVNAVVPPLIAELNVSERRGELQRMLREAATVAALPSLAVLAAFIFAGGPILRLLFGEPYAAGWVVLAILSVGQAVNALVGSCGYTLIMTGHRATLMRISVGSGLAIAALGVALVGPLGAVGVAVATSVAVTVQQVAMLLYARRLAGVWTHVSPALLLQMPKLLPKVVR